ncbi:DUF1330 domain-containing protein [Mycobacterium sp.]|uniref:DUF1330 domain-containing protein n=1 Tax=Mycobacterium sp. TaxID=1785 RepID=UPI002BFF641E|nr:DUF1330 domain-containing protein [Mycobacterium sp.]HKP40082.1 DUF1330 domain-containing protein [Mycobacterium sp.]
MAAAGAAETSGAATSAAATSKRRWPHTSSPKSRRATLPEAAEGDWPHQRRLVIVEFSDRDTLQRWYSSDEYAEALAYRDRALNRRLLFADGV